jgi:hypothetical protein
VLPVNVEEAADTSPAVEKIAPPLNPPLLPVNVELVTETEPPELLASAELVTITEPPVATWSAPPRAPLAPLSVSRSTVNTPAL